jgi:predicted AlkP superfamily pyrophosphatase or phosphodiesterase
MPPHQFAVDVPVTDLDDQYDNFHIQDEEFNLDHPSPPDDIDLSRLNFDTRPNIVARGWNALTELFGSRTRTGFRSIESSSADEEFPHIDDIELINRNADRYSVNSDNDLDFLSFDRSTRKGNRICSYISAITKSKVFIIPLLITTISLSIALIVVVSKSKGGHVPKGSLSPLAASAAVASSAATAATITSTAANAIVSSEPTSDSEKTTEEDTKSNEQSKLMTIVISIDGLHPHYVSWENMPFTCNLLSSSGAVYAPYMHQTNPASELTNLWTISTGLYPALHGIIDSSFYDPSLGHKFDGHSQDDQWWNGVPVWETAEQDGLRSLAFNWPHIKIKRQHASFHEKDEMKEQIGQLKQYLQAGNPKKGNFDHSRYFVPNIMLLHIEGLAKFIASKGFAGDDFQKYLKYVDAYVHSVYKILEEYGHKDDANVIIVSQGSFAPVNKERTIHLSDIVGQNLRFEEITGTAIVGLYPSEEQDVSEIIDVLKSRWEVHSLKDHFQIYDKSLYVDEMYGGDSDRIAPILLVPDVGYYIEYPGNKLSKSSQKYVSGYTNNNVLSRGVFIGEGPHFREMRSKVSSQSILKPFQDVLVYNIICDSLKLDPANGLESPFLSEDMWVRSTEWKDDRSYPDVDFKLDITSRPSFFEELFLIRSEANAATATATATEPQTTTDSHSDIEGTTKGNPSWWDAIEDAIDDAVDDMKDYVHNLTHHGKDGEESLDPTV